MQANDMFMSINLKINRISFCCVLNLRYICRQNIQKSYICYYDKQALEQQVANLVQILGQDALNDLVCGANPKIEFVFQGDFKGKRMIAMNAER